MPRLQKLADDSIARWIDAGEIRGTDAMRQFAVEAICDNVLGMAAGEKTRSLQADYMAVATGFTAVPIRLPGTAFSKAMKTRKRLLGMLREVIAERRANPGGGMLPPGSWRRKPTTVGRSPTTSCSWNCTTW